MTPIQVQPDLFLIPLDQPITGFSNFISAWLYRGEKTFLVDTGPSGTVPELLRVLDTLDVRHIDAILLTHIHIDHAGGAGDVVKRFPNTPVVCHHAGISHLADPVRLWEGSLKVLGATAEAYGNIHPVPEDLLVDAAQCAMPGIQSIPTPGHAVHHISYFVGPYLFAGEAGGVFLAVSDGRIFLRPATPPRFFLETSVRSIDTLLEYAGDFLCYGHFGMTRHAGRYLASHKEQLYQWAEIIRKEIGEAAPSDLVDRCFERLLTDDSLLGAWSLLDTGVQQRERVFILNSIRGFIRYLKESAPDSSITSV